jgi:XTP/dITP diphosphohydrolase
MQVVLASNNAGKLRELRQLLEPLGIAVVAQAALGIDEVEETGQTFVENALIKARHAAAYSTRVAIADDSGLVVPVLGGAPGIHSARYAGDRADDGANNARLISELQSRNDRSAHYYCALVLLRYAHDPAPLIATARWFGTITTEPRGSGGFGYDPYFQARGTGGTAAELDAATKNRLSHRGRAARRLAALIRQERVS